MIDDDLKSYWHSQWMGEATPFPHRVIIDLGEIQAVKGIRIRHRSTSMAGCVKNFCLYRRPQFFTSWPIRCLTVCFIYKPKLKE